MPRTLWKGAVTFGLITIPVKLYNAVENKDVSFHQVHPDDGGRIRYKRVCEECGKEISYADIAKGYEAPDGRVVVLSKEELSALPLPSQKSVSITGFVADDEIDPLSHDAAYYLEAEGQGVKPYVLLRDAMAASDKVAVVKVAIRSREALAVIRSVGEVLVMHTLHWPDEIRSAGFAAPADEVTATPAEVALAEQFIDSLSTDWDPDAYTDDYRVAVENLVEAKLSGREPTAEGDATANAGSDVVDLMEMLQASIKAQKERRAARAS